MKIDASVIQRLSQGDREAYTAVFREYYAPLVVYSSRIVKEREIAEEIARVEKVFVGTSEQVQELLNEYGSTPLNSGISLAELIKRPELDYEKLAEIDENRPELKALINALKSDDIISSCGQRISCFYLCSQVYCAQTGTSALWDVTYEPDVGAMDRLLLISQQVVTFSSTRNVRNLNTRGAYTMYIVGIDIAKRKHEAAVIDGEGAVIIKPFSFTNNCSGYNRLLAMLTKAKLPLDEVSFAMEATGHYWLALFTRLQKEGFRVQVINPVQTNSIRSFYIRQAKTDPRDALLIAEVIRFGHFSESTLHPENIYELRELCRGRHAIVSMQADVKRKVVALLDQVFPEYETAFTNMFSDTSMAILQTCPTPKELSEMPLEELCHLIEVSSHKRFRMAKAQELQALAHGSFGFAMAGDVFSTMIRLYAKHLVFLKQQVQEMDRKIAEIMDTLDTPITAITGIIEKKNPKARKVLAIITYIIVMAFCCIVCYYSTMMVIKYNNTGSTTTNVRWIKMSWIFFQIPLNYVIYILFEIEKIWGVAAGKREVK